MLVARIGESPPDRWQRESPCGSDGAGDCYTTPLFLHTLHLQREEVRAE